MSRSISHKKVFLSVTNDMVIDQRVHRIATTLSESGVRVCVVGRKLKANYNFSDRNYEVKLLKLTFNKGFLFYLNYNLQLFFYLLFSKCNALVANDLDTLPANFFVAKLKRIPLIFDSHEYFPEVPEVIHRKRVQKVWLAIEKWMVPASKFRYTVCQSIANLYLIKYGLQFDVVRNLPNRKVTVDETCNIDIPVDKKIIIYQGALNVGRGIELMMEVVKHLDDTVLFVIGGGPIEEALRKKAASPELENKVIVVGRLPFKELHAYTSKADLGFSLEENLGLNYYFALPNKLFDYIQAGIPVITSDFPEMKAIVEGFNIGRTTNERNPEKLAVLISEMLNDIEKRKSWITNMVKASEELCWERERIKLISIYQRAGIIE